MFQKIIKFIKYNNAFPIGMMIFLLGAGATFASSPAVRESVFSSLETVTSVDNGLIISTNLDNFNFNLKISSVTEDTKNYYINYAYTTLAVANSIWSNVSREKTLTINKEFLGDKDLGLYVARELGDNINYELSYLKKVQELQKGLGVSKKVVTTQYAGLVGKFLDPEEKIIEGYSPVIPEVTPEVASVPEKATAPDPALFIENYPGYVKPALNEPKPTQPVDEYAIRKIVEQMLASQPAPVPETVPEPETTPETETKPEPKVEPEVTPTPEAIPEPEAVPEVTPTPDVIPTPVPDEAIPEPVPDPEVIPETASPEPTPTPTSTSTESNTTPAASEI